MVHASLSTSSTCSESGGHRHFLLFLWVQVPSVTFLCLSFFLSPISPLFMVSIIQVIGCKARLRNDLYCVEWGVELYSNQPIPFSCLACHEVVPLTDYSIIQGVSRSAVTSPSGVYADLRTKRMFPLYDFADTSELVTLLMGSWTVHHVVFHFADTLYCKISNW